MIGFVTVLAVAIATNEQFSSILPLFYSEPTLQCQTALLLIRLLILSFRVHEKNFIHRLFCSEFIYQESVDSFWIFGILLHAEKAHLVQ